MAISTNIEARRHLFALDGLRGVAAVMVVLYHISLVFSASAKGISDARLSQPLGFFHTPLALFIKTATAGPQAVILFFVLSGFVLTRAVIGEHYRSYGQFAIKRFFRIWPAFAMAIVISALLSRLIGRHDIVGGSAWLHEIWSQGGGFDNIWRHLLMTETRVDLDNVMWSLVHELRISFILPNIVMMVRRWRVPACFISIMMMFVAGWISPAFQQNVAVQSYIETASYIFLFAFGAALSISQLDHRGTPRFGWPVGSAALAFFVMLLISGPQETAHVASIEGGLRLLVCGIGATGIIFVTLNSGFKNAFSSKLCRFLGQISYSLYLLHVIVLAAVLNAFSDRFTISGCVLIALALMLPLAAVFQRLVEAPTDRLGRRIAEAWNRQQTNPSGADLAA